MNELQRLSRLLEQERYLRHIAETENSRLRSQVVFLSRMLTEKEKVAHEMRGCLVQGPRGFLCDLIDSMQESKVTLV